MGNKPTNYETFIQTVKPENIPDILQGFCKCSHCTNHYWDGEAAFCHQNANDSNCNEGITEWMSLKTTDYYDIIKNGKKYLYQVPLKYYQELYEIVQLISDYNETHFTQEEIHTAISNASSNRQYCNIDTRPDFIYAYYKDLCRSSHFTEILRCMQRHINSDDVKTAIQKLLNKINSNEWKLRLKEKEKQKMKTIDSFRDNHYFLSNMCPATVSFEGKEYLNVEAAFQAAKCLDQTKREKFTQLTGYQAKKLGRKVDLRPDWEEIKLEIMYQCVLNKFTRNKALKEKLLATGDAELVEGNTWNDTFWGVCNGIGQNHLGKILMTVRSELQKAE